MLKRQVVLALMLGLLTAAMVHAAPATTAEKAEVKAWAATLLDVPVPLCPGPLYTLGSRLNQNPQNPALLWARRVLLDPSSPDWKRACAERLAMGKCEKVGGIKMTHYQPNYSFNRPHYDPLGGSGGPAWGCRKYLRDGDCAASKRWPFGTVFYSPQQDRSLIVVDRGSAVRKANHLDVCVISPSRAKYLANDTYYGRTVWVIGQVTRKQAR